MELYHQHNFLENVLAQRRLNNPWETIPMDMNELLSSGWNLDCNFDATNPTNYMPNYFSSCEGFSSPLGFDLEHGFDALKDVYSQFSNELLTPQISDSTYNIHGIGTPTSGPQITDSSSYSAHDTPPSFPLQEDYPFSLMEEEEPLGFVADELQTLDIQAACKMEPAQSPEVPFFNMGTCLEQHRKNRTKKLEGQPSKNLMAERRRRKRLNDRLSMLRSIVPKISKMDRTSILGDTIDYVKELLEKIHDLQEENKSGSKQLKLMELLKDVKPNEMLVRNSPKFEVEQRGDDTRIEICCTAKPGLLFSTLSTLEALGLEIQQCVISCFNDFAMQASCSEEEGRMTVVTPGEMKQTLFRNAGYGGRCL